MLQLNIDFKEYNYLYIYIYTHTHIYIYMLYVFKVSYRLIATKGFDFGVVHA